MFDLIFIRFHVFYPLAHHSNIDELKDKNYHERLKALKIFSVERRRERFVILNMYKILKGIGPNPGIIFKMNERTGVRAVVPQIKSNTPTHIKNMRINSFGYLGPQLFNALPMELRNFEPANNTTNLTFAFKTQLDKYLEKIPDEPTVNGLSRQANSNSLLEQINYKFN